MRLAFICTEKLPSPAIRGGAIQVLIDGVVPFISNKHQLTIFGICDPDLPDQQIKDGVRYIRVPRQQYLRNIVLKLREMNGQFDVIHVFNRPRYLPFFKAACPRARFVLSLHNEMFKPGKLTNVEGRIVVSTASRIVTVSNFIGRTVTYRFPVAQSKVRTLYSGVDPQRFAPMWTIRARLAKNRMKRKLGIENKQVLLFVGRLSIKKGPHLLIQALTTLKNKHKDLVLVIVGSKWFGVDQETEYTRWLRQLSEPVKDRLIFTGWAPYHQIPDYFMMGDIFVCASQWQEPLARVHYEAMAAGLPIITTNRGGNAEVVKSLGNGIIIDKYNDPQQFVNKVDYLITHPDVAKSMGEKGRALVEGKFNFDRVARELVATYQGTLNSPLTRVPNLSRISQARRKRKTVK